MEIITTLIDGWKYFFYQSRWKKGKVTVSWSFFMQNKIFWKLLKTYSLEVYYKRLHQSCSPMKFAKIFRTNNFIEIQMRDSKRSLSFWSACQVSFILCFHWINSSFREIIFVIQWHFVSFNRALHYYLIFKRYFF